jgi:hypothetical protein
MPMLKTESLTEKPLPIDSNPSYFQKPNLSMKKKQVSLGANLSQV